MRSTISRIAPAVLACALAAPAAAQATSTSKQVKAAVSSGVTYIRGQQQSNGSFTGFGGEWALSALAAAKTAPADVSSSPGSTDARSYYRSLIADPSTWPGSSEPPVVEYENAALAAYAAGIDPARVSVRQNLIAQVIARYDTATPGYYGSPAVFSGTVFGLLALADTSNTANRRVPTALLTQSVEVLRRNQHTDGGWTYQRAEGKESVLNLPSEPDETGAAIAALCSAGVATSDPAITRALSYLHGDQDAASGGFNSEFGLNTDSTAWAVQGLDACRVSPQGPQFTTAGGRTPVDYLISQQLAGGGLVYEAGEAAPNLYSSQDAVRALAGAGFTAPPVTPKSGAPKVLKETSFSSSPGVSSQIALIVDTGAAVKPCAVTIAPGAATTTLAKLLHAAEGAAAPAGCVTSFLSAKSTGAITQVDGVPAAPAEDWHVSIDGGTERLAKSNATVKLGDTIYLRSSAPIA